MIAMEDFKWNGDYNLGSYLFLANCLIASSNR